MLPRTRRMTLAAFLAAAALSIPTHIKADQDDAAGRRAGGNTTGRARSSRLYIVQMAELPVSSYDGRLAGLPATRPETGRKINPQDPGVAGYAGYLESRHDDTLARVGGGRKVYDYRYTFNGFAAELSEVQAELLRASAGVMNVRKDEQRFADTSSTPTFLGLDAPGGLWDQLGGANQAGEEIVIGDIDSGIWPENPSFTKSRKGDKDDREDDDSNRRFDDERKGEFHGACVAGERFPKSKCNAKIVSARWFNAAWGGDAGMKADLPWEFASARDYNGHGTHTAATAAGYHGVTPTGAASIFPKVSGMAPRARIAVYKALWSTEDAATASGFTSDLVAAIDQAVADGVDVINYSISGTLTNFLDPAEVAFLFAADAGVFVSASAGNSGPAGSTVAHPSPWITTVAAGTHNRNGVGSVRLGNGVTYNGASLAATAVGPVPLIDSTAAGLPLAPAAALALCFTKGNNGGTPVLDPAKVAGKIVVCDRGVNGRTDKSRAVAEAGGAGMILLNTSPNSINADFHFVPTVHLQNTDRAAVKAYAATIGATATINKATLIYTEPAPFTAAFSSRGPLLAGGGDLLKPDVIAPGQDILAAVAPPGNAGQNFNVYSGTSMSAPHVTGIAALLKDLHPDWTPMMIKSALMTSASDVLDGPNTDAVVVFRQGAGHIAPTRAGDPGLVYDSDINDWLAFLCGTTTGVGANLCAALAGAGYSLDPSNMNLASIAIGDLAGMQTVKRTVTNVGKHSATYTPSITGMAGFTATVSPSSLTLKRKQSKSFTVTFTRTAAAVNAYTGGQLTWSDGIHSVRSPIVVKPVALAVPASVFSTGGPINYSAQFGYSGPFAATPRGLIPAATTNGTVADDPGGSFSPSGPGVVAIPVTIPAGTTYARFSLFDANVSPASDIDLYVYKGTTLVGASGGGTSTEEVNLVNPAAGSDYIVYVHGFGVPAPGTANFTLFSWLLGSTSEPNMAISAPTTATLGRTGAISLSFSGLVPGTKYLGSVAYSGSVGMPNPTIVRVDP